MLKLPKQSPLFYRWIVSGLMFVIMSFCVVTSRELYPFAPYTMYSYPFTPESFHEVRIFVGLNGIEFELTPALNSIIAPFDEARIKDSFEQERWKNSGRRLESPAIRKKAQDLLKLIIRNTGINYDSVRVGIFSFKNISDLRAGKKTLLEGLDEKIN